MMDEGSLREEFPQQNLVSKKKAIYMELDQEAVVLLGR